MQKVPHDQLPVYGCIRKTNSEVQCFHWGLLRKIQMRHNYFWVLLDCLEIIANSYAIYIGYLTKGVET